MAERPAWLGAKLQAVTPEMAEAMGQPQLRGSIVAWVLPDQPAQKAGIDCGRCDPALRRADLPRRAGAAAGHYHVRSQASRSRSSLWRNGQEIEMKVTLEPWPKTIWERNAAPCRRT